MESRKNSAGPPALEKVSLQTGLNCSSHEWTQISCAVIRALHNLLGNFLATFWQLFVFRTTFNFFRFEQLFCILSNSSFAINSEMSEQLLLL